MWLCGGWCCDVLLCGGLVGGVVVKCNGDVSKALK